MFTAEHGYQVARRRSVKEGRKCIQADGQKKQWAIDEACGVSVALPGTSDKCIYAQNNGYLELSNPGWDKQDVAVLGTVAVFPFAMFIVWIWYCFAVNPIIFGRVIVVFWVSTQTSSAGDLWFGWLLCFPLAVGALFLLYLHFGINGAHTAFFTDARGRIRFNRLTRKVYVLRPKKCGGNVVLDWNRIRAIVDMDGYDLLLRRNAAPERELPYYALILYHPPFDEGDPASCGEDALFVGPFLRSKEDAASLWEYIRRYMEYGPGHQGIPATSPIESSTYCGISSSQQRQLENRFASGGFFYWLSVVTCTWPKFPKEWESDSGIGEPEDKPVQAGAVMTAAVYRSEGKLSPEDNIDFLRHWGGEGSA
ncbi:hypothetical protein [Ralstonia solanacearum]|uniref:Transmembrane protein n=1 Tax=Ralstonia solanacearum TaxID=305 RepID=A0AAD0SBT4_RALSL|nr:hypothetical protein [Ralstonia solanacearum]AXV83783.1 hypothetical protein CJO77_19645 [Ralstonia solanacearum]CBJ35018.1 hypothethical protein [Ralstonia solanacearum PSI07]